MTFEQAGGTPRRPRRSRLLSDVDTANIIDHAKSAHHRRSRRLVTQTSLVAFGNFKHYVKGGDPRYWWASDKRAGGRKASAILGPVLWGGGSDADPKLPKAIEAAKEAHPGETFFSGHILNADYGGDGKRGDNLTILTASANSSNKRFDQGVKRAVDQLHKVYSAFREAHVDQSLFEEWGYGIEIEVEVDQHDTWGDEYPDNCIAGRLICRAAVVGQDGPRGALLFMGLDQLELSDRIERLMDEVETTVAGVREVEVENLPSGEISGQTRERKRSRQQGEETADRKGKGKVRNVDVEEEEEEEEDDQNSGA